MQRVLAAVALLAMTWPQIAVMGCVTGPTPSHASHVASMVPEHEHDGPECRAIMTCNAAMLEAVAAPSVAQSATPPVPHPAFTADAPTTTVLAADPPPPRRLA